MKIEIMLISNLSKGYRYTPQPLYIYYQGDFVYLSSRFDVKPLNLVCIPIWAGGGGILP